VSSTTCASDWKAIRERAQEGDGEEGGQEGREEISQEIREEGRKEEHSQSGEEGGQEVREEGLGKEARGKEVESESICRRQKTRVAKGAERLFLR
jgi:hypothetical protein